MSLDRVISVAEGEVGTTEYPPGSNRVKYWDIFGPEWQGQPWCVAFLVWCFWQAGEFAAFFGGALTASCGTLLRWYEAQGQTVPVNEVQPGDIVILNFNGKKTTDHCGLVKGVARTPTPAALVHIVTTEGNTSEAGNQSNGGMVCEKTRYPSQIVGVCRPKYKQEVIPVDDITGHWSEKDVLWCKGHHIMNGYPDGSFRPENPVLRGEEAAIAHRLYDYTFSRLMEEITELKQEVARLKEAAK